MKKVGQSGTSGHTGKSETAPRKAGRLARMSMAVRLKDGREKA